MLNEIDLGDYYSAGYFLIHSSQRPHWLDEPVGLVPDELISLETEFCPKFHLSWGWGLEDRTPALEFGIDPTEWTEFEEWCAHHIKNGAEVWSMFRTTDAARSFADRFILRGKRFGLMLVGVGLHKSSEIDWQEPADEGVAKRIQERHSLEHGGRVLGSSTLQAMPTTTSIIVGSATVIIEVYLRS